MTWPAGAVLCREMWPLIQKQIPEDDLRESFLWEQVTLFLDHDVEAAALRGIHAEIDWVLDQLAPDRARPRPDPNSLNKKQQMLLMSAAVQLLNPRDASLSANCHKVVGQALVWAGLWDDESRVAWENDCNHPSVIDEWYGTLISMIQHQPRDEALFFGAGNFGSPEDPPAAPHFTGCLLTGLGQLVAEDLLALNPSYRWNTRIKGYSIEVIEEYQPEA